MYTQFIFVGSYIKPYYRDFVFVVGSLPLSELFIVTKV